MISVARTVLDRIQGKAPKGKRRSSKWRSYRNAWIKENPECQVCTKRSGVEAHHVIPFWVAPDLELEPGNVMTLCRRHHFNIGHLEKWQVFNMAVVTDVAFWEARLRG